MTRRRAILGGVGAVVAGAAAAVGLRRGPSVPEGTTRTVDTYGTAKQQDAQWWVPAAVSGKLPTVVLVHGGFWRPGYDRSLEDGVAADLVGRGFLVLNVDYRSSAAPWPTTMTDAATAYDLLVTGTHADRVDPARVAVVGHSAGGHLALWLAARHRLPAGAPGASPKGPRPKLAVGQAPCAALTVGAAEDLGAGAVLALLGGTPAQVPDRYAVADPTALVPTGIRTVCISGEGDSTVPIRQSEVFVSAAKQAGEDATLVRVPGDHFVHLDASSEAIDALRTELAKL